MMQVCHSSWNDTKRHTNEYLRATPLVIVVTECARQLVNPEVTGQQLDILCMTAVCICWKGFFYV